LSWCRKLALVIKEVSVLVTKKPSRNWIMESQRDKKIPEFNTAETVLDVQTQVLEAGRNAFRTQ